MNKFNLQIVMGLLRIIPVATGLLGTPHQHFHFFIGGGRRLLDDDVGASIK